MAGFSERWLIEEVLAPLAAHAPGAFGLADDAAVLHSEAGTEFVVTLDTLIEGVHFRPSDPARFIAKKALRVNVSDLAGKGAEAFAYFLSLGIPRQRQESWIRDFAAGLAEDQQRYGVDLHGGDTVYSPDRLAISVTMIGRAPAGRSVRRSGARPGDLVYVSGTIGDGALGLLAGEDNVPGVLDETEVMFLARRYLLPEPRSRLAGALRTHARAAMDISDGLVSDLGLLCAAGAVSAEVELEHVPLSGPARRALEAEPGLLGTIMAGGDDYELLAVVEPMQARLFERDASDAGAPVSRIGRIVAGREPPRFVDAQGQVHDLASATFRHF